MMTCDTYSEYSSRDFEMFFGPLEDLDALCETAEDCTDEALIALDLEQIRAARKAA